MSPAELGKDACSRFGVGDGCESGKERIVGDAPHGYLAIPRCDDGGAFRNASADGSNKCGRLGVFISVPGGRRELNHRRTSRNQPYLLGNNLAGERQRRNATPDKESQTR